MSRPEKLARAVERGTVVSRVGPRMWDVVAYVARNPGTAILPVAREVGPHGSTRYGYATVHRAIDAGLVSAVRGRRGRWILTVTP